MPRNDVTPQAAGAASEPTDDGSRMFPLDPDGDFLLFIGEPPEGAEPVAGVIASKTPDSATPDPAQLAARLEVATRVERLSQRLNMSVESLLEVIDPFVPDPDRSAPTQLSAHEDATLREIGLLRPPHLEAARRPSTAAELRFKALLAQALSAKEAAKRLGVTEGRVRQRLADRTLYGIATKRGWRLPEFQFAADETLPGLERVLPALDEALHPLAVEGFFTRRQPDLVLESESVSPAGWLAAGGDPTAVADLAGDLLRGT